MKKMYILFLFLIMLLPLTIVDADEISLKSNNAVLYNLNDNKVLYEKNKDQKVSIASLTKLMTALVATENIDDLNQKVKLEKSDYEKLVKQDAQASSLKRNIEYTYEDLLYGLVLESGADCANALARLTAGDEEKFVKKMNEKAKELGMVNTSFSNPIGLDNEKNYSTVNDVAILLKEDLRNNTLKNIITSLNHRLTDGTVINHTIYNYMKVYNINIPYMQGGKTGYELKAGYALASVASDNDVNLMLITSKAEDKPDHILDAKNVYDYYFKNYSYMPIFKEGETLITLDAKYLSEDKINIKADKDIVYYLNKNYKKSDIKTVYNGPKTISLKNRYNQKLGNLKIFYKDELIINYPIVLNQKIYPNPLIILELLLILFLLFLIKSKKKKKKKRKKTR